MSILQTRIQVRKDLDATWESLNPILDKGEPGYGTTKKLLKIGDGVTPWNDLVALGVSETTPTYASPPVVNLTSDDGKTISNDNSYIAYEYLKPWAAFNNGTIAGQTGTGFAVAAANANVWLVRDYTSIYTFRGLKLYRDTNNGTPLFAKATIYISETDGGFNTNGTLALSEVNLTSTSVNTLTFPNPVNGRYLKIKFVATAIQEVNYIEPF